MITKYKTMKKLIGTLKQEKGLVDGVKVEVL